MKNCLSWRLFFCAEVEKCHNPHGTIMVDGAKRNEATKGNRQAASLKADSNRKRE